MRRPWTFLPRFSPWRDSGRWCAHRGENVGSFRAEPARAQRGDSAETERTGAAESGKFLETNYSRNRMSKQRAAPPFVTQICGRPGFWRPQARKVRKERGTWFDVSPWRRRRERRLRITGRRPCYFDDSTQSARTYKERLRGRAGHTIILYDFFHVFFVKFVLLQQLYCSQHNRMEKNTPCGKRHTSRTKGCSYLQSILKES